MLNIFSNPVVHLDKSSELCVGTSKVLDAGSFNRYTWQDGSTARTLKVQGLGTYSVQVKDGNNCTGVDTTIISKMLPLPKNFLPADTAICSYGSALLKASQSFNTYLWSTSSINQTLTISSPGEYWLQVTDANNCTGRDSINVIAKECMRGLFVPSAFTPNKDGKNDVFKAGLFGAYKTFCFTIYNRWGAVLFNSTDPLKGWDGNYSSTPQDGNVFI